MSLRGCTAVINDLAQVYPEEVVLKQLEQLYKAEIQQVIKEIDALMAGYRLRVAVEAYERDRCKVELVEAWAGEGAVSVCTLEKSLKYLLRQQRAFADAFS